MMGTGHVMRCIALAEAWQDMGGKVAFVSCCENEAIRQRIVDEGFELISISQSHPDPSDLDMMLNIPQIDKSWVVLDGYHFTSQYQKSIYDAGSKLLVIDDLNHLPRYHANVILNQNITADNMRYNCDEGTILLLGMKYVLLRKEYLKYVDYKRKYAEKVQNILVTLGGSDPYNVTGKVIESIKLLEEKDISVRVIVGPANCHIENLRRAIIESGFKSELIVAPSNMPDLMVWADMAISAAGTTCWELAFMGVPSITIVTADNQREVARKLDENGLFKSMDYHKEEFLAMLNLELSKLMINQAVRIEKSRLGRRLVTGEGTKEIMNLICTK